MFPCIVSGMGKLTACIQEHTVLCQECILSYTGVQVRDFKCFLSVYESAMPILQENFRTDKSKPMPLLQQDSPDAWVLQGC